MHELEIGVVVNEDDGANKTFVCEDARRLRDEARLMGDDVVTGGAAAWFGIFLVSNFSSRSIGKTPTSFVHFGKDARSTRGLLYLG